MYFWSQIIFTKHFVQVGLLTALLSFHAVEYIIKAIQLTVYLGATAHITTLVFYKNSIFASSNCNIQDRLKK